MRQDIGAPFPAGGLGCNIWLTRNRVYSLLLPPVAALVVNACSPSPRATDPGSPLETVTEAKLAPSPQDAAHWSHLLASANPQESEAATRTLIEGSGDSLPLLTRLVRSRDSVVYERAIDIVHRLGPAAIPLLAEMLEDRQVTLRRSAIDLLVDLAPETRTIQPALRRALKDDDAEVAQRRRPGAGGAAGAGGAVGGGAGRGVRPPGPTRPPLRRRERSPRSARPPRPRTRRRRWFTHCATPPPASAGARARRWAASTLRRRRPRWSTR